MRISGGICVVYRLSLVKGSRNVTPSAPASSFLYVRAVEAFVLANTELPQTLVSSSIWGRFKRLIGRWGPMCHTVCCSTSDFGPPTASEASGTAAIPSSSSSGVPSLQAHESTNLKVPLCHNLFITNNLIGTSAMMITGNAGAPFVSVTMKMTTVTTICTTV